VLITLLCAAVGGAVGLGGMLLVGYIRKHVGDPVVKLAMKAIEDDPHLVSMDFEKRRIEIAGAGKYATDIDTINKVNRARTRRMAQQALDAYEKQRNRSKDFGDACKERVDKMH
jgi:hypothetical protein